MKHLYKLNNIAGLIEKSQGFFNLNLNDFDSDTEKDLRLLTTLASIDTNDESEPDNDLIDFLLNYSKSLEVHKLQGLSHPCVLTRN